MIHLGPTITSGQDIDENWISGLSQAAVRCDGNNRNSGCIPVNPMGAPTLACMVPVNAKLADPAVRVVDLQLGQPNSNCNPTQTRTDFRLMTESASFDSSHDQQEMGLFGSAPRGGRGPNSNPNMLEERQDENRAELVGRPQQEAGLSPIDEHPTVQERRKVGRPIMHKGDPDDPGLTEKERRRIKRRIANRESARRVRYRRQEEMEEMQIEMEEIQTKNRQLRRRVEDCLHERITLAGEVEAMRSQLEGANANNLNLDAEVKALRQSLQVKMSALESELDKHAAAASSDHPSAFGRTTVQHTSAQPSHPPQLRSRGASMEMQGSGVLEMLPSLNLDGTKELDLLPSLNLDATNSLGLMDLLLDPTYEPGT